MGTGRSPLLFQGQVDSVREAFYKRNPNDMNVDFKTFMGACRESEKDAACELVDRQSPVIKDLQGGEKILLITIIFI